MTTATSTDVLDHTSDAGFRVWGKAISDLMTAAGFPKSADTGQINWATANRPVTAAAAGYEIRYLNDSLHATKPIYVKIEYGTSISYANGPAVYLTFASGTNGAGTVSGTTYIARFSLTTNTNSIVTTLPSFACAVEGYFGISAFRRYSGTSNEAISFFILRTVDSSGTPTSLGFHIYTQNGSSALSRTCILGTTIYAANTGNYCLIPTSKSSSLISGNPQLFRHYAMQPDVICSPQLLSFYGTEISTETVITATPIGATSRTYLTLSDVGGPYNAAAGGAGAGNRLAMLWE